MTSRWLLHAAPFAALFPSRRSTPGGKATVRREARWSAQSHGGTPRPTERDTLYLSLSSRLRWRARKPSCTLTQSLPRCDVVASVQSVGRGGGRSIQVEHLVLDEPRSSGRRIE